MKQSATGKVPVDTFCYQRQQPTIGIWTIPLTRLMTRCPKVKPMISSKGVSNLSGEFQRFAKFQSLRGIPKNICQVATSIDINQPFRSESFHVPNKRRLRPEIPRNPGNCGDFVRCQPGICFDGWKSTFLSWWSLFRGELLHFRAVHSRWKFNTNMRQVSQMMSCTPGWCSVKASQAAKLELISSPQEQKGQWTHAPEKRHMKGHSIVPNQAMHYQGQPQTFTTHVWSFEA